MYPIDYVYIIHMNNTNYYKIGYSKDCNKRLKQLQTSNPELLVLYKAILFTTQINLSTNLERYLSDNLKEYKTQGERFKFENIDALDSKIQDVLNKFSKFHGIPNLEFTDYSKCTEKANQIHEESIELNKLKVSKKLKEELELMLYSLKAFKNSTVDYNCVRRLEGIMCSHRDLLYEIHLAENEDYDKLFYTFLDTINHKDYRVKMLEFLRKKYCRFKRHYTQENTFISRLLFIFQYIGYIVPGKYDTSPYKFNPLFEENPHYKNFINWEYLKD